MKKFFINLFKMTVIMIFFTFLSVILRNLGFHESNIIIALVLGVLFVSKFTEGYYFGIAGSLLGVISFAFFFVEPYYSIKAYREDYPFTFLVMLIVAIITSTQTTKIKREIEKSLVREKNIRLLYNFNKGLLQVKGKNELLEFTVKNIAEIFKRSVIMVVTDGKDNIQHELISPYKDDKNISLFKISSERETLQKIIESKTTLDLETTLKNETFIYYTPIIKNDTCLGVIGISCLDKQNLSQVEEISLDTIVSLITMALDKEFIYEKQKNVNLEVEKERVRSNLLRSISHDLRTPLTSIIGSVSTIIDNNNVLSESNKLELLQNIYDDASWLINSSENILSMTKIEDGRLILNKNFELLADIISEIIIRTKKILINHKFTVDVLEDDIFINIDALLILQVLYNLLDNAVKYTPSGSEIILRVYRKEKKVVFEIEDSGKGIPLDDLNKIFKRFYRSNLNSTAEKRGLGLGLAICKSIAKAHEGELTAFNNNHGGATFRLTLDKSGNCKI